MNYDTCYESLVSFNVGLWENKINLEGKAKQNCEMTLEDIGDVLE